MQNPATSTAAPATAVVTTPKEGNDGLGQDQLRLLGLPYGRVASWFWDFFSKIDVQQILDVIDGAVATAKKKDNLFRPLSMMQVTKVVEPTPPPATELSPIDEVRVLKNS